MKKHFLAFLCLCSGAFSFAQTNPQVVDYTQGYFIYNEGWFGHEPGSITHMSIDKQLSYRVFQGANPGKRLGATGTQAIVYGDYIYAVTKNAPYLTIMDRKTLRMKSQHQTLSPTATNFQGRGVLGVSEDKIYVGSTHGIYIYYVAQDSISPTPIPGTDDPATKETPKDTPAKGEVGSMVRYGDRVFAAHRKAGILVIDAAVDTLISTLAMPTEGDKPLNIGSVVLAQNAKLYASIDKTPVLLEVDPTSLEIKRIELPEGVGAPASTFSFAWNGDPFFASPLTNDLYWAVSENWAQQRIYRFNLDTHEGVLIADYTHLPAEGYNKWGVYGSTLRQDPRSGDIICGLALGYSDSVKVVEINAQGEQHEYPMEKNYWFPTAPFFPDEAAPEVMVLPPLVAEESMAQPTEMNLLDFVRDSDTPHTSIWTALEENSDASIAAARVVMNRLYLTPTGKKGTTSIKIKYNSNGRIAYSTLVYTLGDNTGVSTLNVSNAPRITSNGAQIEILGLSGYHLYFYDLQGVCVADLEIRDARELHTLQLPAGLYVVSARNADHVQTIKVSL